MSTISAGNSRTYTAQTDGATFSVSTNGGTIGWVSGAASAQIGPEAMRRTFGPFLAGQTLTIFVQLGQATISAGDQSPDGAPLTYGPDGIADSSTAGVLSASGNRRVLQNTFAALGDSITAYCQYTASSAASNFSGSGTTVVVQATAHGRGTGDPLRITNLSPAEYNCDTTLTRIDANTYSYQTTTPVTTATPTGTAQVVFKALGTNTSWIQWANAQIGGRLNIVAVDGYPGDRADQIALRVPNILALSPRHVAVMAGTNDFRSSANTPAQVLATCQTSIYAPILANGATVYAMAVIPLGASDTPPNGLTVAQANSRIVQFNKLLADYCAATPGMVFVDSHGAIVDTTVVTGVALAAKLQDNIHPSPRGAKAIGDVLAAALLPNIKAGNNLATSPADTVATFSGSTNVIENPFFVANGGGTVGAGVTEGSGAGTSVAQKWRVQQFSTATCTASLVARTVAADGDTLGNNQRMVITTSANNDSAQLDSIVTIGTRILPGDRVYAEAAIKITNTPSNLKALRLNLNVTVDGNVETLASDGYGTASSNMPLEDGTYVFRTPINQIPAGTTLSSASIVVFAQCSGAASAFTVDVGRAVLRKVT